MDDTNQQQPIGDPTEEMGGADADQTLAADPHDDFESTVDGDPESDDEVELDELP